MVFCLYDSNQPEDGSNKPKHVAVIIIFTINDIGYVSKYIIFITIQVLIFFPLPVFKHDKTQHDVSQTCYFFKQNGWKIHLFIFFDR
jgi:hypothetical protein